MIPHSPAVIDPHLGLLMRGHPKPMLSHKRPFPSPDKAPRGRQQALPEADAGGVCLGINIGALTVKVVALNGSHRRASVMPHLGRPLAVLTGMLAGADVAGAGYCGVAGLVYAIAANYLTKVKAQRCVGKKVFLQGGVALNRAVGHAFAHSVGCQVVIPPHPELLGALGVALLALDRNSPPVLPNETRSDSDPCTNRSRAGGQPDLRSLAAAELRLVWRVMRRVWAFRGR